jgi:hypothetical protein
MSHEAIFADDFTVTMLREEAIIRSKIAKKVPGVSFTYTSRSPFVRRRPGHVVGTTSVDSMRTLDAFNARLIEIIGIIPLSIRDSTDSK